MSGIWVLLKRFTSKNVMKLQNLLTDKNQGKNMIDQKDKNTPPEQDIIIEELYNENLVIEEDFPYEDYPFNEYQANRLELIEKLKLIKKLELIRKIKVNTINILRILCLFGFVVFTYLFINEIIIQPYYIKETIDLTRELYNPDNNNTSDAASPAPSEPLSQMNSDDTSEVNSASQTNPEISQADSRISPANSEITQANSEISQADFEITQANSKNSKAVSETSGADTSVQEPSGTAGSGIASQQIQPTPTPLPARDEQGRLLQFEKLLALNEDVKGWLTVPDTTIDYVVMQSGEAEPDYYLSKDIKKEDCKAGSIYLDWRSSVEDNVQSLVIYGHNMNSTAEKMFRPLLGYKPDKKLNIDYYKKHPLITFDSIYDTGTWKIFAVFITTPYTDHKDFFDYRRQVFTDSSDFLNYVYQLRIRSLLNIDTVDINEYDRLLLLSTCSYEVHHNYRTVICARKVRVGEDPYVDTESVTINMEPLYAQDYYYRYGGKAPELPSTFEEALAAGDIGWYLPLEESYKK